MLITFDPDHCETLTGLAKGQQISKKKWYLRTNFSRFSFVFGKIKNSKKCFPDLLTFRSYTESGVLTNFSELASLF